MAFRFDYPSRFTDDSPVLPIQLLEPRPLSPSQRLALAILQNAIDDLRKWRYYQSRALGRSNTLAADYWSWQIREVEAWFTTEEDNGHPFTFEGICECLHLDPECWRHGVLHQHADLGHLRRTTHWVRVARHKRIDPDVRPGGR